MEYDHKAAAKEMKKMSNEHMASIPKQYKAVHPENYGLDESSKSSMRFPEFRLKLKDIPEAKSWEVGERYALELLVEQSSLTDRKGQEPTVEFSVIGVKVGKKQNKKDEKGNEKKEDYA